MNEAAKYIVTIYKYLMRYFVLLCEIFILFNIDSAWAGGPPFEYVTNLQCDGMSGKMTVKCPLPNPSSPYDCVDITIIIEGRIYTMNDDILSEYKYDYFPSFWACHKERGRKAIVIDFETGGSCRGCSSYIWAIDGDGLFTNAEARKIFSEMITRYDLKPTNSTLATGR